MESIAEVASRFLASLSPEDRVTHQSEVLRFARWFGSDRGLAEVTAVAVERYQEQVIASGAELSTQLSPVKAFLSYAQRQGHISSNLAKFVRLPRLKEKPVPAPGSATAGEMVALTPEGRARLRDELAHLVQEVRPEVARALYEARQDKDIRENAPYDAAKQHQALVEARIRELEAVLSRAEVTYNRGQRYKVSVGTRVVLWDLGRDREATYTVVSSSEANPREGKISAASPVGKALLDRAPGDTVEVATPAGTLRYRVERVEG